MSMVQRAAEVAAGGGQVDGADARRRRSPPREDAPQFGSTPISCSTAPAPYIARLQPRRQRHAVGRHASQAPLLEDYYAMDLLDGTEIRTEPLD